MSYVPGPITRHLIGDPPMRSLAAEGWESVWVGTLAHWFERRTPDGLRLVLLDDGIGYRWLVHRKGDPAGVLRPMANGGRISVYDAADDAMRCARILAAAGAA